MKKFEFKFKNLELVKGCPTDINGNAQDDDDYNSDGFVDQYDQDYYDGYIDGYSPDGDLPLDDENCDAYNQGLHDGQMDEWEDSHNLSNTTPGPDIEGPDFTAPAGGY